MRRVVSVVVVVFVLGMVALLGQQPASARSERMPAIREYVLVEGMPVTAVLANDRGWLVVQQSQNGVFVVISEFDPALPDLQPSCYYLMAPESILAECAERLRMEPRKRNRFYP